MAVSEEDIEEQETVNQDFRNAEVIFQRIIEEKGRPGLDSRPLLFALCIIYSRQLSHHKYEETEAK